MELTESSKVVRVTRDTRRPSEGRDASVAVMTREEGKTDKKISSCDIITSADRTVI